MAHLNLRSETARGLFLDLLYKARSGYERALSNVPTHCLLCRNPAKGGGLCAFCEADALASMLCGAPRCAVCCLALGSDGRCEDCLLLAPAFDRVIAAFDYALPGDLLIHYFKKERRFAMARMLARLLAQRVLDATPALPASTILVSVPASRAAIRERGFNPAAEVARYLAHYLRLAYVPQLISRRRESAPQKQLSRSQRAHSALQLYACTRPVNQLHIAVIDDVLTTGSTLHGIARELKTAGAASVTGLVLARTPTLNR